MTGIYRRLQEKRLATFLSANICIFRRDSKQGLNNGLPTNARKLITPYKGFTLIQGGYKNNKNN